MKMKKKNIKENQKINLSILKNNKKSIRKIIKNPNYKQKTYKKNYINMKMN